jgi:hypothetical protein
MRRNRRNWRTSSRNSPRPASCGGLIEVAATNERVFFSVPHGGLALSAMRVVAGWVASCHDLPLDRLDDIHLAIETLLGEESDGGGALSLTLWVEGDALEVLLDGLKNPDLQSALARTEPFEPSQGCPLDVTLFLDALVDSYLLVPGSSGAFGVRMQKRIA